MAGFDKLSASQWRGEVGEQSSAYFHAQIPRVSAQVAQLNATATRSLATDTAKILQTFTYKGGFASQAEAQAWLKGFNNNPQVTAQLIEKAQLLPEPQRTQWLTRLSAPAYVARMTRKQALAVNINLSQGQLFNSMLNNRNGTFGRIAEDGYRRGFFDISRTAGLAFKFDRLPQQKINAILNGAIPQKYLWYFTTEWASNNQAVMLEGILTGKSAGNIAKGLRDTIPGQEYRSYRYVRTYVTSTTSVADTLAMEQAGLSEYEFYATMDDKTCELCGPLDGQRFTLDEEMEGENSPPIHYNCRCRKVPIIPGIESANQKRIARDADGNTIYVSRSMKYGDYQKKILGLL